jgi:hypothetical protein
VRHRHSIRKTQLQRVKAPKPLTQKLLKIYLHLLLNHIVGRIVFRCRKNRNFSIHNVTQNITISSTISNLFTDIDATYRPCVGPFTIHSPIGAQIRSVFKGYFTLFSKDKSRPILVKFRAQNRPVQGPNHSRKSVSV